MKTTAAALIALIAVGPVAASAASRCQDIAEKIDFEYKEVLVSDAYVEAGVEVTKRGFAGLIHGQMLVANVSLASANKCPLPSAMAIPGDRYGRAYLACYKQLLSAGTGGAECLTLSWKPDGTKQQ